MCARVCTLSHILLSLLSYPVLPEDEMEAGDEDENEEDGVNDRKLPLLVLPLYSMLSTEQQAKVYPAAKHLLAMSVSPSPGVPVSPCWGAAVRGSYQCCRDLHHYTQHQVCG